MDIAVGIDWVARAFEVAGVALLALGALWAAGRAARDVIRGRGDPRKRRNVFPQARTDLGRAILLGLEVLVAADIIRTVAVRPTLAGVSVLGLIVLIRTFLSFSLEIEIEGRPPWRREGRRHAGEL